MSIWQRFGRLFEQRQLTTNQLFELVMDGAPTYAGPQVNPDNAMRSSAVYACIRIISESIAALPLVLYRTRGRNKERATNHPVYPVLHDLANSEMTAFEWRELMIAHCLLRGNGWSEKEFDGAGRIVGLWPLNPAKMEGWDRRNGMLHWIYRLPNHELRALPAYRIHHLKGLGDGIVGNSPIMQAARQAIGLSLATEESGSRLFSNGSRPGLVLRHPGKLSPTAHERLRASFASEHQGLSNAHRTKILEEGMDISTIGFTPEESQFLETRKFQVTEIARIYRVPPHMLADLDRATFSNIEQQSLSFVTQTLMPWFVRHEQAIYRDLLTEAERKMLYARYVVAGMLRGDTATRYQAYTTAINTGFMTRNEARELEDLNPLDGLDEPLLPLNMMEAGSQPQPPAAPPVATEQPPERSMPDAPLLETRAARAAADRHRILQRSMRLWEDAANRLVKREIADIRKAMPKYLGKRSVEQFETWLRGFYEELRAAIPSYFDALMTTYAEEIMADVARELDGEPAELTDELRAWITTYLENMAASYAVGSSKQLNTLLATTEGEEEAEIAITERLDGWEATKATNLAREQAFEAGNALAIYGYLAAGVSFLRWVANAGACPLCQKMNGRRIPIVGAFLDEGDEVTADGVSPLPVIRKVKHGPLHDGCECTVIAG